MNHVQFLLLGVGSGAVFAAVALALVVTYRSSGVINFAASSVGLYAAYTYALLRQGQLFVPIPGLPTTVGVGGNLGFWPAMLITLVIAAVLGLIMYVLVFRPLRTAPPVAGAVASLGIATLFQALITARLGSNPVSADPIFPSDIYHLGTGRIPGDRLWLAATIIVVALVIGAAYRFTRFGLVTRATAETERGAVVSGIAPDRVAALNWMISAVVAGLAGILIAPIIPLVPSAYTLFIVPALAAAIIGRFQYIAIAVAAGLAIGMLQSEAQLLQTTYSWLPQSGLSELIPLVLVLVVLLVRAKPLPSRGAIIQQTLGRAPRPRHMLPTALVSIAIASVGLVVLTGSWRAALVTSLIMAIIALSLVVVTGYAGQVSLAQLALAGAAAYLVTDLQNKWHVPFPISVLVAALAAAVVAVVVGLPALRIRGLPVAVVTLGMALALEALWFRNNDFNGGFAGAIATGPKLFGLDLGIGSGAAFPRLQFCFLVLIVLVVIAFGVAKLRTSWLGSAMLAVRANERSAAAAGVNVVRIKLAAFAISGFVAGIGGAFLAYRQGIVAYDSFTAMSGLALFTVVYLAGITSVAGGITAGFIGLGGLVFVAMDRWLALGTWYDVITTVLLVVTIIKHPEGIVGTGHHIADRLHLRRRQKKAAAEVTKPVAEEPQRLLRLADTTGELRPDVLSVDTVRVSYGGVVAVSDVSFDLQEGSITGLIGPNGAGKTTLIDALSGFATASGGVTLAGTRLDHLPPHRRIRSGLGRTFQAMELYDDLTVAENVRVGLGSGKGDGSSDVLAETLELVGLLELQHSAAGDLSQGQRQLVSIARALVARPRVLLLDEPAAGLDTTESEWLAERLRRVRDAGITVLLVDHDMGLVLGLCDHIHVLALGELIASGPPSAIRSDSRVAEAYLGNSHGGTAAQPALTTAGAAGPGGSLGEGSSTDASEENAS